MTVRDVLDDVVIAGRLVHGVRSYFRRPLTVAASREMVARRRATRRDDFLRLITSVYADPDSLYLALLRHAGCELADVVRRVDADGIEAALYELHSGGVYLTSDEFRGRRRVVRGSLELDVHPALLRNRSASPIFSASTSGSAGRALSIPIGITSTRDRAANVMLGLAARGGVEWRHAIWAAPGLSPALWYSATGRPIDRWFSHLDIRRRDVDRRHRLMAGGVRIAARSAGVALPPVEHVSLDDPGPVLTWLASVLHAGSIPHLFATVSAGVRVAQAALRERIDIAGAQFSVGGEPITAERLAFMRTAGVDAAPDYGSAESGGPLAYACLDPVAADEVHFFDDLHAVIAPREQLFITSLRPGSPFVLLNASLGDHAIVDERRCLCPLGEAGWRVHVRRIRSHEKLTIAGFTFLDSEVIGVLDEALPAAFGGAPTDYQLVEQDAHIVLRIAPHVGDLEVHGVRDAFLAAIAARSPSLRTISEQWRDLVRVERSNPVPTPTGKILHMMRS